MRSSLRIHLKNYHLYFEAFCIFWQSLFVIETYQIRQVKQQGIKTFVKRFEEFEVNLYSSQKAYFLHQFECQNDQFHSSIIKNNGLGMTFHMDFSENISHTPKEEPQDSHFGAGSTQISLYCTVVHPAENSDNVKYSYNLSTDHDSIHMCNRKFAFGVWGVQRF